MKRKLFAGIVLLGIAGLAYLATVGCCTLLAKQGRPVSWADRLELSSSQRSEVSALEIGFLRQRTASCQTLCAKRAQLIELLKQPTPDRQALAQVVNEIAQEQAALERATLDYMVNLKGHLGSEQQERLVAMVGDDLRTACQATACGASPGCFLLVSVQESPASRGFLREGK